MTHRKKEPLVFNDQYTLGFWTEYANTFSDKIIDGLTFQPQNRNNQVIGSVTLSAVPNRSRILLASKVYGFCEEKDNEIADFETNSHPYRIFRLHEYKELKENFRYTNPQRFMKLYNKNSYNSNGIELGTPFIIDSQVPQPPNYIVALDKKLTSQWSINAIYGKNTLKKRDFVVGTASFCMFDDELFKRFPPFSYNFVDAFVNKIWTDIKLSESLIISANKDDAYSKLNYWFDEEDQAELPQGNHFGLSILPYTASLYPFTTSNPTASALELYRLTSTTKGPVHIGLGRAHHEIGTNIVQEYHQANYFGTTSYLDVVRNTTASYFDIMGSQSTRNFIFYNTGAQENLSEEWFYSFPFEHKFKNLERLTKPKRFGNATWATYDRSGYSVQGWRIPENLTEQDIEGSINDKKIGTLFWKFDYGISYNKYFPSLNLSSLIITLPATDSANILGYKGVKSHIMAKDTVLSPTIVLADFVGTPKGYFYTSQMSKTDGGQTISTTASYPMYPKLEDMYDPFNLNMDFSLSFTPTYPRIQDVYKSFYGFGDGVVTTPSEYMTGSANWADERVFDNINVAHRQRFIWGKGKIPSFKHTYKSLHSMTYSRVPLPNYEMPVTFSRCTGSAFGSNVYMAVEPEIIDLDSMKDFWPDNGLSEYGPLDEKPTWWEGPCVVSGPVLRGYKYGLFDCLPRVPTSIFRRDKFGQLRDMLEQRLFYATKFEKTSTELYTVTSQFVNGSEDKEIWDNYNNWEVGDPEPTNKMDAGLYELHSRVAKPFNESGWV